MLFDKRKLDYLETKAHQKKLQIELMRKALLLKNELIQLQMDYDLGPVREYDPALVQEPTIRDTAGLMMKKLANGTVRNNEQREIDKFRYATVRKMQ